MSAPFSFHSKSNANAAPESGLSRRQFLSASAAVGVAAFTSSCSAAENASSKKMKVAVIGHTGQGNYGHGLDTVWLKFPELEVVAFADADDAGREKQKSKLPGSTAFADYHKMLSELKPEVVSVAARHLHEHHDMIMAAIENGAKAIYVEKPFCRTPAEADDIVAAAQKTGTKIAIAHRNRFHPALNVVLEEVKNGTIGDVLEVRSRGKEDQRGGCLDLWVLGTHCLDLILPLCGKPVSCSAEIFNGKQRATKADIVEGAEGVGPILGDRLHARFEMENGVPVYFESVKGKGVPKANFGVQLIGNKGIIDLRVDVEPLAHLIPGNPFLPTKQPRPWIPITSAGVGKPEVIEGLKANIADHSAAVENLLASVGQDWQPLSNAETGRQVVEMTHAVFASHVADAARVSWPLENRGHGLGKWLS